MADSLLRFDRIVRRAVQFTEAKLEPVSVSHPFDDRNIHQNLPPKVRRLFDDGHYPEATFEAFKFVDKEVQRHSGSSESGYKLMMQAFSETSPLIRLNTLASQSEKDEQQGFKFIFSGSVLGIRNPRGHEHSQVDSPDACLDYLSLASLLIRRLEISGYKEAST